MRRNIDILKIKGLSKSIQEKQGEFVIHVKDENDYRLKSKSRDEIIEMVKKLYF